MAMLNRRIVVLEKRARTAAAMPAAAGGGRPLTGEELAARLGVAAETIRRWAGQGMPSCGTHPARPSWPVYDEAACWAWAAANQPQTGLRPPTGDGAVTAPAAAERDSLADLRARKMYLQCQAMRLRLINKRAEYLEAEDCRAVWRQHAGVVRRKVGALPAATAGRLAEAFGLGEETRERFAAILAAEVARVAGMVPEDPLNRVGRASRGPDDERT